MIDIEKLSREAGATTVAEDDPQCWIGQIAFEPQTLERFAALVLEEAAKVCYDMQNGWPSDDHIQCGDAIKALKQNL